MSTPKLLVLDIETSPHTAYVWKLFDENVGLNQLVEPSRLIAAGWRWLDDPASECQYRDVWPHYSPVARRSAVRAIHAAMSKADAYITFNGTRFDLPRLNGEFLLAGLPPLPKKAHIDVYRTIRGLGLASGKLEYVAPLLGVGKKGKVDFALWRAFMERDPTARDKMRRYNIRDVNVLARLFTKVRPYVKIPRLHDRPACPDCGGQHAEHRGHRKTDYFLIERLHCLNPRCGRWYDGDRRKMDPKPTKGRK